MSFAIDLGPNGSFRLQIPNGRSGAKGHHIDIPCTLQGLKILRRTLLAAKGEGSKLIGSDAAPIQHMVEQWLQADRAANELLRIEREAAKAAARSVLADLENASTSGLDLSL